MEKGRPSLGTKPVGEEAVDREMTLMGGRVWGKKTTGLLGGPGDAGKKKNNGGEKNCPHFGGEVMKRKNGKKRKKKGLGGKTFCSAWLRGEENLGEIHLTTWRSAARDEVKNK